MNGLKGLINSKKATLCLIIFACSFMALMLQHLDGLSFAAIVSSIVLIYNYTQNKADCVAMMSSMGKAGKDGQL